jgi:flavin reductase (DIM6/NTAB) family NADH-FMN oxidoreductase RutF
MTGVTVVTAIDASGAPLGFTANSFSSVSLDPPLLLVCLAKSSQNFSAFTNAQGFAVNVLSETQKDTSNTFAHKSDDRFSGIFWNKGPFGSPILANVSAWFDCSMHNVVDAGDHVILIGQVQAFQASTLAGLGYARGAYVTPSQEAAALNGGATIMVSALIERDGQVLLVDDGIGGTKLPNAIAGQEGANAALKELIKTLGVKASVGFIYSVFEDSDRQQQNIVFLCMAEDQDPQTGVFTPINLSNLTDIAEPAICVMLERFAAERQIGSYGIYVGNQNTGEVQTVNVGVTP